MKMLILSAVLFLACVIGIAFLFHMAITEATADYMKPDTTITIHNGRPDTVIIKKQKPWWLK